MKTILSASTALFLTASSAFAADIPQLTQWYWQLDGNLNTTPTAKIYDIDMESASIQTIDKLHSSGHIVICYFSAGSWENWRDDADQFPSSVKGKNLDGWPGEKYLDIRNSIVRGIMSKRMDTAKSKNCDAVEPDNVDTYTVRQSGFPLTATDQIDYNKFLAAYAHSKGMKVALKNDTTQIKQLVGYFDFAIVEECFKYNECKSYSPFAAAGKAVLVAEYSSPDTKKCVTAKSLKFSLSFFNVSLNGKRYVPCS